MRREALRWQVLVLRVYSLGLTRDVSSRRDTVRGLSLRGVSPCLLALALGWISRSEGGLSLVMPARLERLESLALDEIGGIDRGGHVDVAHGSRADVHALEFHEDALGRATLGVLDREVHAVVDVREHAPDGDVVAELDDNLGAHERLDEAKQGSLGEGDALLSRLPP